MTSPGIEIESLSAESDSDDFTIVITERCEDVVSEEISGVAAEVRPDSEHIKEE